MSEFVKRIVMPISLPVAAIGFVALMVFSASRILLAVPEVWSTSIALTLAAVVLFFASVLAAVKSVKASQRALSVLVGLSVLGAGGVGLSQGIREIEKHADGVPLVARGIAWETKTLSVPAGIPFAIALTNEDTGVPHNIGIYTDPSFTEALYEGPIFAGVATQVLEVEPLEAGVYPFRCDVHPDMIGSLTAGGAGGAPVHGAPSVAPTDHGTEHTG